MNGLRYVLRHERNARIHLAATLAVTAAGWWSHLRAADWRWIALAVALVWCAEAINTAIEYLCDVVSPQHREAVAMAKDIAAGAVLICAVAAVIIGGVTFWPYWVG